MDEPLLKSTLDDERLELAAAGAWTADHARKLEPLIETVNRTVDRTVNRNAPYRCFDGIDTSARETPCCRGGCDPKTDTIR